MIRFLIKLLFFLFFIFVTISFFVAKPSSNDSSFQTNSETTTGEVVVAFRQTLNDLGKFCDRNIEACKVGKSFLSSLGERARDGARAAYEYFGHILDNKKTAALPDDTSKIGTEESTRRHKALP
ncbi:hypothetical protein ME7_00284 [Bartonella birtlesii LL-WM9]|uniref:Uncharacterized protein n=1 Tax=Bartonella birtlesii LL-WM9 TaxID=1094552 RepID=J0YTS5_9HYPH|nr:DUF5330 domain-containing protein [Bartonella birtlesii]EJF78293.1 hypothetical protein ME7_00284 [Bartonella birtlesii LL-WM9]